jgi:hypothetical protein
MPIRLPRNPPIIEVPVTQVLWRVHRLTHEPLWFGPAPGRPPQSRFDAPAGEFSVCYVAGTPGVAILETLVRGLKVPIISRSVLHGRGLSAIALAEPLRMLQLEGKGLASFGLSAHEISGPDLDECQELARRVHETLDDIDGIQYRSRWDTSELCWAVFDRARVRIGGVMGTQQLENPAVVRPALLPYRHVSVS